MSGELEQTSLPCRHSSCQPELICGILRPISSVKSEYWTLPGQRELCRPKYGVTEKLWHWLMIWGLEPPCTLECDRMATARVLWYYQAYVSFNQRQHSRGWSPCKRMMQLYYWIIYPKTQLLCLQMLQTTEPYESEMSKLMLQYDSILSRCGLILIRSVML
jgi:hypothetical protein